MTLHEALLVVSRSTKEEDKAAKVIVAALREQTRINDKLQKERAHFRAMFKRLIREA